MNVCVNSEFGAHRYQHSVQQARQGRYQSLRVSGPVLRRRLDLRGHRIPGRVHPAFRARQVIVDCE